ncbi:unnamed protein product [Adineta ricciae]|uniref:ADP ribosyltransferase domain-containing protein n=1 Tax=Adineta ricciae TaxID=249248 RepID=A0A815GZE2_ADIRI|nr:unnamed protein product [Adineta ricciae]
MNLQKSTTLDRSSDMKQTMKISTNSESRTHDGQRSIQLIQNIVLIWLDNRMNIDNMNHHDTMIQLKCVVDSIYTFNDYDQCVDFVTDIQNEKVFMVISDISCENIVPLIHDNSQLYAIFIFVSHSNEHEQQWAQEWPKIRGLFSDILPLCDMLKSVTQQCQQNTISMSFIATDNDVSKQTLDRLDSAFMYTQIIKDILLTIKFEQEHIKLFVDYCRNTFVDNERTCEHVNEFGFNYKKNSPIWWYTYEHFLYSILNRALRLTDTDIIIKMGFFITDLHRQIEELHKRQFNNHDSDKLLEVYRGQGLTVTDFEKMKKTKGGLLAFNSFLSTSTVREVSLAFAESNGSDPNLVGVLFVMSIDSAKSTTPFASINDESYFQEEDEILFSMHTVFRINDIKVIGESSRLFQVDLTLTDEDDKDLRVLTDCIREETYPDAKGWYRLGVTLHKMGQFGKSQQVYETLLSQTTDENEMGFIYYTMAHVKYDQGDYEEAISLYENILDIFGRIFPPNHINFSILYNSIGFMYSAMGEYSKALSYYENCLQAQEKLLPVNYSVLSSCYSNMGRLYQNMAEYAKSLVYCEKVLEIDRKILPSNHPTLSQHYIDIGTLYQCIGEYSKALPCYEKALDIKQRSLPPNHPSFADCYNSIGMIYENIGEYSKALAYYQNALEISEKSLPENHPNLAASYNNIGIVYENMNDFSKAISSYEKALELQRKSLSSKHPDLAASHINIGNAYDKTGDYSKAYSCYEKALEIQQISLPSNHPELAASYGNMGVTCMNMKDYSKALHFLEKTLAIQQESLPSNHPSLAASYSNIAEVYENTDDLLKSRSFYERGISIGQQTLPMNHPHLQEWRKNLENVNNKLQLLPASQ